MATDSVSDLPASRPVSTDITETLSAALPALYGIRDLVCAAITVNDHGSDDGAIEECCKTAVERLNAVARTLDLAAIALRKAERAVRSEPAPAPIVPETADPSGQAGLPDDGIRALKARAAARGYDLLEDDSGSEARFHAFDRNLSKLAADAMSLRDVADWLDSAERDDREHDDEPAPDVPAWRRKLGNAWHGAFGIEQIATMLWDRDSGDDTTQGAAFAIKQAADQVCTLINEAQEMVTGSISSEHARLFEALRRQAERVCIAADGAGERELLARCEGLRGWLETIDAKLGGLS